MLNIRYTKKAFKDLDRLFKTIFSDKPLVALEYVNKLREYIKLLETNPNMGVDCKKKAIKVDCKILIFENYNIYYTIEKDYIKILTILNSKQQQNIK